MALDDRISELAVEAQDPFKVHKDFKKWNDKNQDPIRLEQVQPALDNAYTSFEKALKKAFTPDDKKNDANFDVSTQKTKDKKDEVYKALNAFTEKYFEKMGFTGTLAGANEISDQKDRFEFYVQKFDQLTGSNAREDYNADKNPTMANLMGAAQAVLEDKDAKVSDLHEAVRGYHLNPKLANKAFGVKQGRKLGSLIQDMDATGLALGLKSKLTNWKVDNATLFYDPAQRRELYINFAGAIEDKNLEHAAIFAKRLGLKYDASLN